MAKVTFLVTAGPIAGQQFVFAEPNFFVFGRHAECNVRLPKGDLSTSRRHFMVEVNPPLALKSPKRWITPTLCACLTIMAWMTAFISPWNIVVAAIFTFCIALFTPYPVARAASRDNVGFGR